MKSLAPALFLSLNLSLGAPVAMFRGTDGQLTALVCLEIPSASSECVGRIGAGRWAQAGEVLICSEMRKNRRKNSESSLMYYEIRAQNKIDGDTQRNQFETFASNA